MCHRSKKQRTIGVISLEIAQTCSSAGDLFVQCRDEQCRTTDEGCAGVDGGVGYRSGGDVDDVSSHVDCWEKVRRTAEEERIKRLLESDRTQ